MWCPGGYWLFCAVLVVLFVASVQVGPNVTDTPSVTNNE